MKKTKNAQTWSIDIIIGMVLFLLLLVVIYTLVTTSPTGVTELKRNADIITTKLDTEKNTNEAIPKIIQGNTLSQAELERLMQTDYEELKSALGITGNFCIVITYMHGGIHNITENIQSYGKPEHELIIGQTSNKIICGQ